MDSVDLDHASDDRILAIASVCQAVNIIVGHFHNSTSRKSADQVEKVVKVLIGLSNTIANQKKGIELFKI